MKIFLVEDSPMLRERLEALVATIAGAAIVGHAAGTKAAVEGILAQRPDVVVLDIHLADGTGFDVLRGLRGTEAKPDIYVLTNYPQEAYRQAAHRLGARGFFDKSSEIPQLLDALAALATSKA